ncbi:MULTISPECIES: ABC transporter substrate-binding protein [unclassified Microbacterium]|uniref:ABC transporter substrate-binding protein n=1 Tax=unclassified Microbacterium TaxID=2609290 RepID=UPI003019CD3F
MVARRIRGIALASAVTGALLLSGCSGTTDDAAPGASATGFDGTFTVYASLAMSGPLAGIATANRQGLEAAVDAINAAGGIEGREVTLIVGDDGADPTKATTLLQEKLDEGEIDFVIAGNTSNVGLALLPLLTCEEIFSSGQQAAINDPSKFPYHFGLVVPNSTQNRAMVERVQEKGYKKVALLHTNDANGEAIADTYRTLFGEEGIEFVDESFAPTDIDMTAQLQRLQAQNPDVLILSGLGSVAGYELQSRTKLGWDIPTLGHSDLGTTDLAAVSGTADWNNVEVMTFSVMAPDTKRSVGFDSMMNALHDAGAALDQPISQYTVMWDILWVAKAAVEEGGGDAAAVKAAYESMDIQATSDSSYTFMPYYRYTPEMHQLVIEPRDAMTFVTPGPFVDGLISSN